MQSKSVVLLSCLVGLLALEVRAEFKAGAAVIDVTPRTLPVLVSGYFLTRTVDKVKTPLNARAIVLDDGKERLALVVVDSCMMPRSLLDDAKRLAASRTEIRADRMLISATHTHTAPSCMGLLGTDTDGTYGPYLRERIAQAIAAAEANLEPARVGWAVASADRYTAVRRWIRRSDRLASDPFGNPTIRADMHAALSWDDVTGASGPEDPDLSLISFQAKSGRPIALLANFSMHYFAGEEGLSADYFGLFCEGLAERIPHSRTEGHPPFVGIMSAGCSGDTWRRDYDKPVAARLQLSIETYTEELLAIASSAYKTIEYKDDVDLAMAEARLQLKYRVPDQQRLEWAERIVDAMGDGPPKNITEVYAREQILLHERQSTEIVVQAVRIGDIAVVTTPNETYALTGLKLKRRSPLPRTMVVELANGGDGYIPPPEQHWLGGYTTWPARSAGLEIQAEPKIVETALGLLEEVAGRSRRVPVQSRGAGAQQLLASKPVAYWRLDETGGRRALDSAGNVRDAVYESGIAFFLEGPRSDLFCRAGETNRAAHFAGGRLQARIANLGDDYSVSLWFWNGMPVDARETTGWMFSRGHDHGLGPRSDHLGLGGTATQPGKLIFLQGDAPAQPLVGRTKIPRWSWNQAVLVRSGPAVRVYLNGHPDPEIEANLAASPLTACDQWFVGGRCDNESNWEGRLDEIAIFDRALSPDEVQRYTSAE